MLPGFIKFLEPYYMILVTKRRLLGSVNGHSIYGIGETKFLSVPHPSFQTIVASSRAESRLGSLTIKYKHDHMCYTCYATKSETILNQLSRDLETYMQ